LLPAIPAAGAAELPLGPRSLDERRSVAQVAPGVRWTRIVRDGGPWRVNVLTVAAGARVLVQPAGTVGKRARPSTLLRRVLAVAAVNGSYFDAEGNPIGALASGGRLHSEPVGGRSPCSWERRRSASGPCTSRAPCESTARPASSTGSTGPPERSPIVVIRDYLSRAEALEAVGRRE
jgi:hypothetical protein